ncbi:MAG: CD1247 N-terminal domain-containing protein [Oscillospiraceae bacterium]
MNLSEKAAYIKGLAEGLELDTDKKEARVIKEMLELLGEMASDVEEIGADLGELCDAVEEIDEDLAYVEEEVFGDIGGDFGDELYEITCPNCQEIVRLDEEMLFSGDVVCPGCGEKIELEIDACDCGHHHD